ncbi:uncharacterized protein LOC117693628 [Arvicanthis niloticus]|uniref:uncharacterized protein LOC117693628 n=1 Tax=Arvicanthis niloticus TaxID=61156 RepID=UPI00402BC43E
MGNCCETRVVPRNKTSTPSSSVEEGSPKSLRKVEPQKDQHATHVLRQSHHRNIAAPLHADEHQVRACTSRDNPQAEATVLPECADNTLDKGKAHLKVAKLQNQSKRRKCLSSILKKFSRKKTVAPLVVKRRQVLPVAFTETAQITTEVLPENADAAPSAGEQGEPPVGMAKEERKKRRHIFSILRGICRKKTVTPQDTKTPSASEGPSTKTTEKNTKDLPENTDNQLTPDDQKRTPDTMESVEVRRRRLISLLIKTIKEKQAMDTQNAMGPEVHKDTSAETTVHSKKDVPEHTHNPLPLDDQKGTPDTMESVEERKRRLYSMILKKLEAMQAMYSEDESEPELRNVTSVQRIVYEGEVSSLLKRFYKKDPRPSQAWAEPPGPPSTSKETAAAGEQGMQNVPDIKQLFFKKGEFEPHDEGSWEEYQSYFPHAIHVPDSRQTLQMVSTMVESSQVGDSDVEEQQEQLDSKENFPDAYEVQRWEMRKRPSTLSPAVNTLFVRRPMSSESDEESTPIRRKKRRNKRHL